MVSKEGWRRKERSERKRPGEVKTSWLGRKGRYVEIGWVGLKVSGGFSLL